MAPDLITSLTSPLRIAEVPCGAGRIGITLCPGKVDPHAMSGPTARDLDADIGAIAVWGARAVLTLLEDDEFALLHVSALGETVARYGMEWFHLPIVDHAIPDAAFEARWATVGPHLEAIVRDGGRVLVHCRGGLGRSGTIVARMLVELGASADDAIARVRAARAGTIETREQEGYVRSFAPVMP